MSYFKSFPWINYPVPNENRKTPQVNITRRSSVVKREKDDKRYYYEHTISDTETPIIIADKVYEDADAAWVILMFNDIVDIFEEWPRTQMELQNFIYDKYDNPYAIHHYESIATGAWVDPKVHPDFDVKPITNYEYEEQVNDEKRKIKLPSDGMVPSIISQHNRQMQIT